MIAWKKDTETPICLRWADERYASSMGGYLALG
jgi:hypothetical protein